MVFLLSTGAGSAFTLAGAPTAVATYIMACSMGGDGELAGTIVLPATDFSTISYTFLLLLLQLYGICTL
jgi:predicted permease